MIPLEVRLTGRGASAFARTMTATERGAQAGGRAVPLSEGPWAGVTALAKDSKLGTPRLLMTGADPSPGLFGRVDFGVQVNSVTTTPLGSVGEAFADALARQAGRAPSTVPGVLETINTYRTVSSESLFGAFARVTETHEARTVVNSGGDRYVVAHDVDRESTESVLGFAVRATRGG